MALTRLISRLATSRIWRTRTFASMADEKEAKSRFAVFITGPAPAYCEQNYGNYGKLFVDLLKEENEHWDTFEVMNNQFPPEVDSYRGFVLTGSRYSAHDNDEWIVRLKDMCADIYQRKKKIVGICFGHQLLSNVFGGQSGRADVGWEVGVKRLQPTPQLQQMFPEVATLECPLNILQTHQDQVLRLPSEATLLASSEKCPVEMYSISDRVLCMQGHPEYNPDILRDIIQTRKASGVLPQPLADQALESLNQTIPSSVYRKMIRSFLTSP
eukprot:TRINITY_DN2685_c0_g1_i1.p1 TRINITY_DN2685_c0_g1~~TRINITY_DN2685_c0_g1_i1.p1  ORF type:complete len:270 (+),score=16.83 TRINITY_DN2685_c0_g1_i1:49-858(+)